MGYNTDFNGELEFTTKMYAGQLAYLNSMLSTDIRDHPEWSEEYPDLTHINLELTEGNKGIRWNGDEKSYDMTNKVNLIIQEMRKLWPEFGLKGTMEAQGESMDDRWILFINDKGLAEAKDVPQIGPKIKCPHCEKEFKLDINVDVS